MRMTIPPSTLLSDARLNHQRSPGFKKMCFWATEIMILARVESRAYKINAEQVCGQPGVV